MFKPVAEKDLEWWHAMSDPPLSSHRPTPSIIAGSGRQVTGGMRRGH